MDKSSAFKELIGEVKKKYTKIICNGKLNVVSATESTKPKEEIKNLLIQVKEIFMGYL